MAVISRSWVKHISIGRVLVYGVFLLCAYASWARGGCFPPCQWPLGIVALLLCGVVVFLSGKDEGKGIQSRMLRDPLFYVGAVFLLLLVIQWSNSGYGGLGTVEMPCGWVPWSVGRDGAGQMLHWFFPAWIILLIVRNILQRSAAKLLLQLLALNSAVLACAGILQYAGGSEKILGIWPLPGGGFFATFGYANHASAYFYLNAALAAGLTHDAVKKRKPVVQCMVWGWCFLLCVLAAVFTLSRAGFFVALMQLLVVVGLLWTGLKKRPQGLESVNICAVMAILILGGFVMFLGAGGGSLAKEVRGKKLVGELSVVEDLSGRIEQMPKALGIIRDYPVFGSGGWSYPWLAGQTVPDAEWDSWMVVGQTNVHCDPVQFLSEFGVVGWLCMAGACVVLLRSAASAARNVCFYWIASGLVVVFVHGLIDLPFRCPAILLEWCSLFAALPRLVRPVAKTPVDTPELWGFRGVK